MKILEISLIKFNLTNEICGFNILDVETKIQVRSLFGLNLESNMRSIDIRLEVFFLHFVFRLKTKGLK